MTKTTQLRETIDEIIFNALTGVGCAIHDTRPAICVLPSGEELKFNDMMDKIMEAIRDNAT